MYVVTQNDQVLLGPIAWNARYIASVIEDDTAQVVQLLPSQQSQVPLNLGNGIMIRNCRDEYQEGINSKIQMYQGPTWTFTETEGIASYTIVDKPIELVKSELKQKLAEVRYNKEISGTTATIQNNIVGIDTARGSRDIFVQQYLLLPEGQTTVWKFPEMWLTLTKSDLGQCVAAGVAHVQGAFTWESAFVDQINAATTLAELDAINFMPQINNTGIGGA